MEELPDMSFCDFMFIPKLNLGLDGLLGGSSYLFQQMFLLQTTSGKI